MKFFSSVLLSGLVGGSLLGAGSLYAAGTITGKVNFKGTAPKVEEIKMTAECKALGKKVMKEDVVVNKNNTLKWVLVSVKEGVKKEAVPADLGAAVTLDQLACQYTPHVMGVRVGQVMKIVNSDTFLHNVNGMAKANAKFNNGMTTKGQSIEKKFTKPEAPFKTKCDVHGWMSTYIGVFDHPFFAVTDDQGAFNIKGLPAGDYVVEAWHEKMGAKTEKVTVTEGGAKSVDFTFGS